MNETNLRQTEEVQPVRAHCWTKRACLLVVLTLGAFGYTGCVATGVGVGYDTAYYAPTYSDYYGDYGYGGDPYWGGGPYVGSTVLIAGRSHRGYYGGHHFARDFRGGAGGFSRGGGGAAGRSGMSGGGHGGGRH
jgi:hypothetical protein